MNLHFTKSTLILLIGVMGCFTSFAQSKTVKGVVKSADTGEPLQGVTIGIKGEAVGGTFTNSRGEFSLVVPSDKAVLKVTSIGYQYQEIPVGKKTSFTILMQRDTKGLNEVVVVGYGTQKKSHLTGSVGVVNMKAIEDVPVGSLSEALRGQVNGLSVSGGFQRPGQPATLTIRNPIYFSKDGGSKEPLYVIDDIVRTKTDFDLLDASEIESITVLKDAEAAIYGIIGSNGVIVVRTKHGKAGPPSITYSASFGTADVPYKPKMMNSYQLGTYLNDYLGGQLKWDSTAIAASSSYYTPDEMDYFKTHNTNWLNMAIQPSFEMRHALNISGGSERATYFAGASYNDQNSNFPGLGYKRYSVRASSDFRLATGLKLGLSVSGNYSNLKNTFNKQGGESLDNDWKTLITKAPFYTPYINGLPILIPGAGTNSNINDYNYFAIHDLNNYTSSSNSDLNFQANLAYEIPFIKGLTASVNFNKNIANTFGKQYGTTYKVYQFGSSSTNGHVLDSTVTKTLTLSNGDRVRINPTIAQSYQLNASLNYNRIFGKHEIGAFFSYEQAESFTDGVAGQANGVVVGGLDNQNFATGDQSSNETISEWGREAYIGRINYSYADKYLLQLQFRADASVNFAPENRWGYFPSASAGWIISQENFFSGLKNTINFLKIRGSASHLGLDATKPYQWLRSYAIQTGKAAVYGGNNDVGLGVVTNVDIANRNVHWDNDDKYDAGLDAQMFDNRLSVTADYYFDHRFDLLTFLTTSPSILIGSPLPSENYSAVNTFGYEITAGWNDKIARNLNFDARLLFNWSDNKVLKIDQPAGNVGTFLDEVGKSTDLGYYGYKSLGILRTQADVDALLAKNPNYTIFGQAPLPGMLYFQDIRGPKDANGNYTAPDGKITSDDQTYLNKKAGNHYGLGFNWDLSYKSLHLRVVSGISWGGIDAIESAATSVGKSYSNLPAFWADHWTPTNTNAKYPSPYYSFSYNVNSDFWWKSATTWTISTISLSYDLPPNILRSIKMNNARVYFVSTNPFNLYNPYNYKSNLQDTYTAFPQLRTMSLGLSVNL